MTSMSTSSRAVVLASGGLDSTVTAAIAKQDGCELFFLTLDYGQRHVIEVERARRVATAMGAAHHTVLSLDLRAIGGSALTSEVDVPKDRTSAANVLDYSGYPDCRPEFIEAFEQAVNKGTRAGQEGNPLRIRAPLLAMTKVDIIRTGMRLQAPLHLTHSCYDPIGTLACGRCDSCLIRREGFAKAGVVDPTAYAVT
jgi:7-cyano-7-deazaguanine synthase